MEKDTKIICSISDLLSILKDYVADHNEPVWFRGHSNKDWTLLPSLLRIPHQPEENYITKFQQNATMLLNPLPANSWEWLFVMRHYDVPTRLLDWTESPLVATYFVVTEFPDLDGVLWILLPLKLNTSKGRRLEHESALPSINDEIMKMYAPQYVSMKKYGAPARPIAFNAPRNTQRMQSQLSVFTISSDDTTPLEIDSSGEDYLWKCIIPQAAKQPIQKELNLLAIKRFQLYPELESIDMELSGNEEHDR